MDEIALFFEWLYRDGESLELFDKLETKARRVVNFQTQPANIIKVCEQYLEWYDANIS